MGRRRLGDAVTIVARKLVRGFQYLCDYTPRGKFGTVKALIAKSIVGGILTSLIFFGSWGIIILLLQPTGGIWDYVKYCLWWLWWIVLLCGHATLEYIFKR